MSMFPLERARIVLEDGERYERACAEELKQRPSQYREGLEADHRVASGLAEVQRAATAARATLYEGESAIAEEKKFLSGETSGGTMKAFYARLNEIRQSHRSNPERGTGSDLSALTTLKLPDQEINFTGEESFGRNVDLHDLYREFINLSNEKMSYLEYVKQLRDFSSIPSHIRRRPEYKKYLDHLYTYLSDFHHKVAPLHDLRKELSSAEESFRSEWETNSCPGWTFDGPVDKAETDDAPLSAKLPSDIVDKVQSVSDAENLGLEKLKEVLHALGLKSGGTLEERAERLVQCKDVPYRDVAPEHKPGVKRKNKQKQKKKEVNPEDVKARIESFRKTAELESKVGKLLDLLHDQVSATVNHIHKKQSLTYEEMLVEAEMEDANVLSDDDSDDEEVYNPKNVPLGWDGKPMPFWLYKLYGLNREYKCEICGEASYWGPRAFDRHFNEWRHRQGLRLLGVPDRTHRFFHGVVKIQDAQELNKRLDKELQKDEWEPEQEECEDADGNVFDKKTYDELVRQGLV